MLFLIPFVWLFFNFCNSKSTSHDELSNEKSSAKAQHEPTIEQEHSNISPPIVQSPYNEKNTTVNEKTTDIHLNDSLANRIIINDSPDESLGKMSTNLETARSQVIPEAEVNDMEMKASSSHDQAGHWPLFDKKSWDSLCKMENCSNRTRVYCEKCDLHFCFNALRNCFYKFHKRNYHVIEEKSKQLSPKQQKTPKNTCALGKPASVKRMRKTPSISTKNDKAPASIHRKNAVVAKVEPIRTKKVTKTKSKANPGRISKLAKLNN